MTTGAWVLLVAVLAAVGWGTLRAARDGRFRGTHRVRGAAEAAATERPEGPLSGTEYDAQRGERATLVQFSTAFCAPCRAARRTLAEVAETVPGVTHVEIDAESHLDLVRRVGILRTPTTLVLDAEGVEHTRASGAPTRAQVLQALGNLA